MTRDATYWIKKLVLQPHPEGGYYRQTYRSDLLLPSQALPREFNGPRAAATSIFFLLDEQSFSAFHRLRSDELWHFHIGGPLLIHVIAPDSSYSTIRLGSSHESGETLQAVVKAGSWFGSHLAPRPLESPESTSSDRFALVGCTVTPGFDFEDFELARRADLLRQYPQHREIITKLSRA
jgi:uncharacterized protein